MNWHVYELLAIDFGWEHVKTVKETLVAIASGPDELNGILQGSTIAAKTICFKVNHAVMRPD